MAQPTLDELYIECATLVDETINKTGSVYTGDSLKITNIFKKGLNYAKNKILREKYSPIHSQTFILDRSLEINIGVLTKTFIAVYRIEDSFGDEIGNYRKVSNFTLKLPDNQSGDVITLQYRYKTDDLSLLTDVLDFPDGIVDAQILCFFAAYKYLIVEGSQDSKIRANDFLNLFNDGFDNIIDNVNEPQKKVKQFYSNF
jgi:hypothetical protein